MGLISEILGTFRAPGARPARRSIGDVEAALARLAAERTAASEALQAALREREDLLLVDESDERIAALDATADNRRLTLERCDKAEPILLAEIEALRSDAKRERWRLLSEKWDAAMAVYVAAFRAALEAHESLSAVRGEAQNAGFAGEAASFPIAPHVLAREVLAMFELEIDRRHDAARGRPAPPRGAAPAPKPAAKIAAKMERRAPPPPPPLAPPRAPFEPVAGEDGLFRVQILKNGYERPDGRLAALNEIVALPRKEAFAVVANSIAIFEGYR